ncbi:hypothetical protein [Vibrio anguillarum]|uniref:hypothetical protein n=1 Tax=Vibrio anguillarum TaxID=55601 RepID=UPI0002EDFE5B|nr:hypothetical protein [Vibrio anguillarum]OEE50488.1 hypothetical protein A1QU_10755 [Vibrio anguillarum]
MHKLQNGSQVAVRPARKPQIGTGGYFSESNDSSAPSYPGQDFFNDCIDEFSNALAAAGIAYDPLDLTHLSRAIQELGKSAVYDDLVGFILPDSASIFPLARAFLCDGSDYAVADYPKLMSRVLNTPIMVAQTLIDANPEEYAANYGISADGLSFTVPNYPLRPHVAAAGVFGVVGATVADKIQNMTGRFGTWVKSNGYRQSMTDLSGAFGGALIGGDGDTGAGYRDDDIAVVAKNMGAGSDGISALVKFDASRVARTGTYTEVNSSFLNFYIIHGEKA